VNKQIYKIFITLVLTFIFISCKREVSISEPFEHEVGVAKYFISTTPQGAAIFMDERNTGLFTPDTVKWLSEGNHNFVLKMDPFLDYLFTAEVDNNQTSSTEYNFYSDSQNFGSLNFNSSPEGCSIFLDDSLLSSKTPYTLGNLLPAKYKVKYTYPEHRADSTSIFVYAGKQAFVSMDLPDTTVWVTYDAANSYITDNTINDIVVDDNNILWIGTWHHGIIKVDNGRIENLTEETSNLPNDIVNRIKIAPNGKIWVGTYVGLARIDNGIVNTLSGLPNNYITDFDFDASGNIWVGTRGGLFKYDGTTLETFTTSNSSIPGNFVTAVLVDQEDPVWIGTNQFNTAKFQDRNSWITHQSDSNLVGDSVLDLIEGNDNKLWISVKPQPTQGKMGGIYILDNGELNEKDFNVSTKRFNRFFIDDDNTLWVGSRAGVISVNSSGSSKIYIANSTGLPTNDVLSMAKDKDDNMWFGTNGRGIVKYKIWNE